VVEAKADTMFGEMAPLTAQRLREAYAEAAEPSDVCVLKREDPERLVRGIPDDVGLRMIRGLSERLRVCETRLEDVGFRDVPARLASLHPTAHRGRRRYDRRGTPDTHALHPPTTGHHDRRQPRERHQGLHEIEKGGSRGAAVPAHLRQGCRSPGTDRRVKGPVFAPGGP
jgi:hypothetical protein